MQATSKAREASIAAVVIRCGCKHPEKHPSTPCPKPRRTDDLGVVSYFHRSALRRAWWSLVGVRLARVRITTSNRS
jgi:hypothetical protein